MSHRPIGGDGAVAVEKRSAERSTQARKSNSTLLRESLSIGCGPLYATYDRFWRNSYLDALVPAFLILMHQIVRASVPLMTAARARARDLSAVDSVGRVFGRYLKRHIEEERQHDVWLLRDLVSAGWSEADVLAELPSANVAALVGAQYYWIHHHHPIALLGYMIVLEGNPPSSSHVDRLQRATGLPPSLFDTYRLHGVNDPAHLQELGALLDSLRLSESQFALIGRSAVHTAHCLAGCLEEIEAAAKSSNEP